MRKYNLYGGHTPILTGVSFREAHNEMWEFIKDNYEVGNILFDGENSSNSEKCWNITNRGILSDDYFVIKEV